MGSAVEQQHLVSRSLSSSHDRSKESKGVGGSAMLSEANADRLANALCRMRGAALKLGKFCLPDGALHIVALSPTVDCVLASRLCMQSGCWWLKACVWQPQLAWHSELAFRSAGQMLSIQDENVLPPQFAAALEKVRAGTTAMLPHLHPCGSCFSGSQHLRAAALAFVICSLM